MDIVPKSENNIYLVTIARDSIHRIVYNTIMDTENFETATFAGGCFWCTEAVFKRLKGVEGVVVKRLNETYLFVAVNFLQQGASVRLEDYEVRSLE